MRAAYGTRKVPPGDLRPAWTPDDPQLMLLDSPTDGGVRSQPESPTLGCGEFKPVDLAGTTR